MKARPGKGREGVTFDFEESSLVATPLNHNE